jgi:hypothetical protein
MLAFADAFRAIMLAFLAATLLVPLIRKVVPPRSPLLVAEEQTFMFGSG